MMQYDKRLLYWSKTKMVKKKKLDLKKTAVKVARISIEVAILGTLAYITERPELIAFVPVVEGIYNIWKHRI
jgi:hypothetical protein